MYIVFNKGTPAICFNLHFSNSFINVNATCNNT